MTIFMVAMVLVIATACGSRGEVSRSRSAPLKFDDGFARVDVPLSAREVQPVIGGRWILLYGGVRLDSSGGHTYVDGALYDVDTQSWTSVPAAPFEAAVWSPAAVWTGREFVVFGTPCAHPRVDNEDVDFIQCGHLPAAAAFDPAARRWRQVQVPDLGELSTNGNMLSTSPLGLVDGRAVFVVSPPELGLSPQLVSLDPDGTPEKFVSPAGSKDVCALGDHLFAFGSGDDAVLPTPAGRIDPTHTWSYRDGGWVEGGGLGPSTTETFGSIGGRVSCSPSAIGLVGIAGYVGRGGWVDWFDAAAGWRRLPPIEPERFATTAAVAQSVDAPVVWIGDRISVLRAGVWSHRSTVGYLRVFPRARPALSLGSGTAPLIDQPPKLAAAGRYLVGRAYSEPVGSPALVFVDVDTLPTATGA